MGSGDISLLFLDVTLHFDGRNSLVLVLDEIDGVLQDCAV